MKTATGVVLVWLAGAQVVCGGQGPQTTPGGRASAPATAPATEAKLPYGDAGPIPQDREVVVSVEGNSLRVKSNDALIHVGRPLRFVVQGLRAGQSVEIDFEVYRSNYRGAAKNVKGPFPLARAEHPANPVRGRFVLSEKYPRVDSEASDTPGYFKYHVVLRSAKNEDLAALDPGVLVKNDY